MLRLYLYARVRLLLFFCTRDRGCSKHPAFPAPSSFRGETICKARAKRAAGMRRCVLRFGATRLQGARTEKAARNDRPAVWRLKRRTDPVRRPGLEPGPITTNVCTSGKLGQRSRSQPTSVVMGPGLRRDDVGGWARGQRRHSGAMRQHRTSDVQLHIGESQDSGSGPSDHPGMTLEINPLLTIHTAKIAE